MKALKYGSVAAVLATFLSLGGSASAQTNNVKGFAVDKFDPAERGSDWFSAESLDLRGHGRFAVGMVGDYNKDALIAHGSTIGSKSIVSDQMMMNLGANAILWSRLRLGLNAPLSAYASGQNVAAGSENINAPKSTSFGDVRLASDVRLFGEYGDAITGALGVAMFLPTGARDGYTSDGTFRATPRATVAGKYEMFEYSAHAGYAIRAEQTSIQTHAIGSELQYGGAAGVRFYEKRILVGPEFWGGFAPDVHVKTTSFEALMGVHAKLTDSVRAMGGAGAGLAIGYGTPAWRVTMGLEWAPGYDAPKAPAPPAVEKAPPPEPPPVVAVVAPPPPPPPAPVENPDRDSDGLTNAVDACPDEPGPIDHKGCPLATVKDSRIVIAEQIKFRTGSAELDPASDPILNAVNEILLKHQEIQMVRIEGHTDNVGGAKLNVTLSKNRAASVAKWLAQHGIDDARLASQGFGASQPLAPNTTADGRRENRRVEFHIVGDVHASR